MPGVKWGILATGKIAQHMAQSLTDFEDAEIVAVASRDQGRSDAFAQKWSIPRAYDSYEALLADPDIEVVYVATPHAMHYENMLSCLNAGKHVLCEKALTLNTADTKRIFSLAAEKNLFVMEAMWMAFIPAFRQLKQWLDEGVIGEVLQLRADFCINRSYDPKHRLFDPKLGGGALYDVGIYPLAFACLLLGMPKSYQCRMVLSDTGVDVVDSISLQYPEGSVAHLTASTQLEKPVEAWIQGSKGYIQVHDVFFRPDRLTLCTLGKEPLEKHIPFDSNGYIHELREVHACLQRGTLQSDLISWDYSIRMMELMQALRQQGGVVYAGD